MTVTAIPAFIAGGAELFIIFGLVVLLFGAKKLPKLAHSLGASAGEFKKGRAKTEQELEELRDEE